MGRRLFISVTMALAAFAWTGCGGDGDSTETSEGTTGANGASNPAAFCKAMADVDRKVEQLNKSDLEAGNPADMVATLTVLSGGLSTVAEASPPELEDTVRDAALTFANTAVRLERSQSAGQVVQAQLLFSKALDKLGGTLNDVGDYLAENC